jgi:hypothetical protein
MRLVVLLALACLCAGRPVKRNDPALSWLAYSVAAAPEAIQFFSASMIVPPKPRNAGAQPAFWIGLAPSDGLYLAQPITPKWLGDGWYVFDETYDWTSGNDFQSNPVRVMPGDVIYASVKSLPNSQVLMSVLARGRWANATVTVPSYVRPLTVAYVVLEHQPDSCDQLPASDSFVFSDLAVQPAPSAWKANVRAPSCNSTARVTGPNQVTITWRSN